MANVYEACRELFADYPLAIEAADDDGKIIYRMVLMLQSGDTAQFFVLSHDSGEDRSCYSLCPWPTGEIVNIEAAGRAAVPDVIVKAVAHGLPVPRDGSLFGWNDGSTIGALTAFYTKHTQYTPQPIFTSMPVTDCPEAKWPPYADEPLFGRWFWDGYRAGRIIPLGGLIAKFPNTVYWVDVPAIPGSGCCAVARDVRSPAGFTLKRGCYVYYKALRSNMSLPSLTELLADTSRLDLAPGFHFFS